MEHSKVHGVATPEGVIVDCACGYQGSEEDVDEHIAAVEDDE